MPLGWGVAFFQRSLTLYMPIDVWVDIMYIYEKCGEGRLIEGGAFIRDNTVIQKSDHSTCPSGLPTIEQIVFAD